MADVLVWTPTEFTVPNFTSSRRYLRKRSNSSLAVSAGRTWTTCSVVVANYLGHAWRPYRFSMGSAAPARDFVSIHPDGGNVYSQAANTPPVNPVIITATI